MGLDYSHQQTWEDLQAGMNAIPGVIHATVYFQADIRCWKTQLHVYQGALEQDTFPAAAFTRATEVEHAVQVVHRRIRALVGEVLERRWRSLKADGQWVGIVAITPINDLLIPVPDPPPAALETPLNTGVPTVVAAPTMQEPHRLSIPPQNPKTLHCTLTATYDAARVAHYTLAY